MYVQFSLMRALKQVDTYHLNIYYTLGIWETASR